MLGHGFPYELILAVSPVDETVLGTGLEEPVGEELLYQRGLLPNAEYTFKHALIQEAAYESLPYRMRRQYHRRVLELEERFPEAAQMHRDLLADIDER